MDSRHLGKGSLYREKGTEYFENLNHAVISLLEPADVMLEIGCGSGELARYARERRLFRKQFAIEINSAAAKAARRWFDKIHIGDIESTSSKALPVANAIICADVLEHLVDPWTAFQRLVAKLVPDGYLILSIPNARHVRVWGELLLQGRFDYKESGVLDKGHLRFFGLKNLQELFTMNQMKVERMIWNMDPKGRMFTNISLGMLKDFFTFQFVFRLRKAI